MPQWLECSRVYVVFLCIEDSPEVWLNGAKIDLLCCKLHRTRSPSSSKARRQLRLGLSHQGQGQLHFMIKSYNKPRALGYIKTEVIICLTLEIHLQVEVSKGHPKFPVLKKTDISNKSRKPNWRDQGLQYSLECCWRLCRCTNTEKKLKLCLACCLINEHFVPS